jgi:hypothetical protein
VLIAVVCVVLLAACSDRKAPAGANKSSSASAASRGSAQSAPPASFEPSAHTTTSWPPAPTTTTTAPKNPKTKTKPAPPPPVTVVCDRLSAFQLQAALGVEFSSAAGTDSSCNYDGKDGSQLSLVLKDAGGNPTDAVNGARTACDPGTDRTVAAGSAGFDCLAGGTPIAVTANDNTFFRLAWFKSQGDASHEQEGLGQLLTELA